MVEVSSPRGVGHAAAPLQKCRGGRRLESVTAAAQVESPLFGDVRSEERNRPFEVREIADQGATKPRDVLFPLFVS